MGDDKELQVAGMGTMEVPTKEGIKKVHDIYYTPHLKHNFLSVGQMMEKNYKLIFENGTCVIFDKNNSNRVVTTVSMTKNRLFPLKFGENDNVKFANVTIENPSVLWHLRYGHLNFDSLKLLTSQNMVCGLPKVQAPKEEVCKGCALGKHTRSKFPKDAAWRASYPLQLVHLDICGPMQNKSWGGHRYFLTFIDDFSRLCWVYFLQTKDQVFACFQDFKNDSEKQSGFVVKCLRTDNGGEFCSIEFLQFCKNVRIKRQYTASYTPQQNGVVERKNRTIVEMTRSMLQSKELSNMYWAEAIRTSVYILNRCPTYSLDGITPYEGWYGKKPNVKHFQVFGCLAYAHIPDEKR